MADKELAADLVSRCFNARTYAHFAHLQTRSYAEHVALRDFYEEIVGLADAFAESFQGKYGLIPKYPDKVTQGSSSTIVLSSLQSWIDSNRADITDASFLQNQIDEILALVASTLYKLRFLE